ncbi:hypothetical protein H6P81_007443 [Aristolochia fimbriata]|uniref:Uncharacterized protein n=1 Tax=Aristolochia fimbriata TaxID=158543 RepID=A0AAV7F1J1_ARIFI|nr:hypothetical protein H6P81_007443 [Aristolochia fimbriata]
MPNSASVSAGFSGHEGWFGFFEKKGYKPAESTSYRGSWVKTEKDDKKASSAPQKNIDTVHKKVPRFAPELDGLHCFETVVPF